MSRLNKKLWFQARIHEFCQGVQIFENFDKKKKPRRRRKGLHGRAAVVLFLLQKYSLNWLSRQLLTYKLIVGRYMVNLYNCMPLSTQNTDDIIIYILYISDRYFFIHVLSGMLNGLWMSHFYGDIFLLVYVATFWDDNTDEYLPIKNPI